LSNPKLAEQFDEFTVELLVAVFGNLGVTLEVTLWVTTISLVAVRRCHRPKRGDAAQALELPRSPLLRTWVNKGKRRGAKL